MAKTDKTDVIRFQAQISGIRTVIDGGSNVTFALQANEIKALTQLLQVRQQIGVFLEIAAVPIKVKEIDVKEKPTPTKRKQRYPYK